MDLTYPGTKSFDVSKPESYWFFYWKTSPSLWEAKLQDFARGEPVFIPVYWGLHANSEQEFDFGRWKPETDLKRLVELCHKYQLRAVFLIPIGAFAFLANGGVPAHILYKTALNKDQTLMCFINESGEIHKFPSFFHMGILQEFQKFVSSLGNFLTSLPLGCEILAAECGSISEDGYFRSFFQDYSSVFSQSFSQFLRKNGMDPFTMNDKNLLKKREIEFRNLMFDLYFEVIKENARKLWGGKIKLSFLGTHSEQFLSRLFGNNDILPSYIQQFFNSLNYEVLPSSLLIPSEYKEGILDNLFQKYVNRSYLSTVMQEGYFEEDTNGLVPLHFIEFLGVKSEHEARSNIFESWSLKAFFEQTTGRCYQLRENIEFSPDDEGEDKFIILEPSALTENNFNVIYKYLFQGMSVVISDEFSTDSLKKKLDIFLVENNISTEELNILGVNILFCELGTGSLFVVNSQSLESLPEQQRSDFWSRVFSTGKIQFLEISTKEEIEVFWFKRTPFDNELSYEHIRRVSLVNPFSHKVKASIKMKENFAFIKMIDQEGVQFSHDPKIIKMEFQPKSKISLEFGYYE